MYHLSTARLQFNSSRLCLIPVPLFLTFAGSQRSHGSRHCIRYLSGKYDSTTFLLLWKTFSFQGSQLSIRLTLIAMKPFSPCQLANVRRSKQNVLWRLPTSVEAFGRGVKIACRFSSEGSAQYSLDELCRHFRKWFTSSSPPLFPRHKFKSQCAAFLTPSAAYWSTSNVMENLFSINSQSLSKLRNN